MKPVVGESPIRYVWFDQDDTLYDYSSSTRRALSACLSIIHESFPHTTHSVDARELVAIRAEISRRPDYGEINLIQARNEAFEETLRRYASPDDDLASVLAETYFRALRHEIQPYEGVEECLRALTDDGHVLGIVSNGLSYLRELDLAHLFQHEVYANDLRLYKPDRAIFEHAMALAGARPEECLLVGDSCSCDVIGAQDAGWTGVWLNRDGREWDLECEPPEHMVSCLSELPGLIRAPNVDRDGRGEQRVR